MSAAAKQTVPEPEPGESPEIARDLARGGSVRADGENRPVPHGALLTRLERGDPSRGGFQTRGTDFESELTASQADGQPARRVPRWIERLLRTPLPVKLVGANVLLLVVAAATALVVRHRELSAGPVLTVVIVAYLVALLLNTGLVMLAVRPLRVLEKTVDTIWHGDLDARVPTSLLADRHVTRVARMFNILLDGLVADRARTRRLATGIIDAGDRERAAISRELHDSAAQSLAALAMQLGVAVRSIDEAPPEALRGRIEEARALANSTLEEIRMLAHTMHPRVLDDLGLVAALRRLARETTDHSASQSTSTGDGGVVVAVTAMEGSDDALPAPVKSVLYRVAQEAVQNARKHAAPRHIEIRLHRDAKSVMLEVADDGRGFDLATERQERTGIGLFTMRERVALVDGELRVSSRPGGGTSVIASIPLHESSTANPRGAHT
jgi:signal transduction histidine kinase